MSSIEELFDGLDAALFSGDAFVKPENRKTFRGFMARWERGLSELDAMDDEVAIALENAPDHIVEKEMKEIYDGS